MGWWWGWGRVCVCVWGGGRLEGDAYGLPEECLVSPCPCLPPPPQVDSLQEGLVSPEVVRLRADALQSRLDWLQQYTPLAGKYTSLAAAVHHSTPLWQA